MTETLYMEDSYLKEFDATVKSVSKGKYVVLDKTAFFPKGGGVEWDTGVITRKSDNKEFKVVFVGKFSGEISHEVDNEGLKEGDEVHCKLDWDRRYLLMRYHTSAHLVSGAFNKEYGLMITGNQLTTEKGRIDLDMETMDLDLIKSNLLKKQEKYQNELNSISKRLSNKGFVDRAPKEIVEQEKTNYNNLENDIKKISLTIEGI